MSRLTRNLVLVWMAALIGPNWQPGAASTPTRSHWYSIARVSFFGDDDFAAQNYANRVRKGVLPELKDCEMDVREYKQIIAEKDQTREVIQISTKAVGSNDRSLVVTVTSETESFLTLAEIPCGNTHADVCADMFIHDLVNPIIEHDKNCHRGRPCPE
jgi:hypothetical protein